MTFDSNLNGHTKDYIIYNYEKKILIKMEKIQACISKINIFFCFCLSTYGQVLLHGYI